MRLPCDTLEAWSLLSYIAARTSKIGLGTCVTPMTLRSPKILAKTISTVDVLSNGRVVFGVGTGWTQKELEAFSQWDETNVRIGRTDEGLQLMIKLWTEDKVTFDGKYYSAKEAVIAPKPVQKPHPPIWVGSLRSTILQKQVTAKYGDAWVPWSLDVKFYGEGVGRIKENAKALNRADKIAFGMAKPVVPESMRSTPLPLSHHDPPNTTVRDCIRLLEDFGDVGLEFFVPMFFPPQNCLDIMDDFVKNIFPSFSK